MRDDVIKQISALKNINHIIVLTHNIDFVFLQTVFLSALRQCGHPGLTLFADAQCARESYRFQSSLITGLGRRFRVIPVRMNSGYRFHPKAIFLAGDEDAVLFVGSGNMTFGGLRENAEIWKRFDTKKNDFNVIAAFQNYLSDLSSRVAFEESVKSELMELFDEQNYEWVTNLKEASGLLGRVSKSDSLIQQMQHAVGEKPISKITVSTPYFDPEARALKNLSERYPDSPIDVLLQSGQSTLFLEAANNLPSNISLKSIGFADPKKEDEKSRRFIHAKYYAFHHGDDVDVFAGSANCSIAALIKGSTEGNAELMVHEPMDSETFKKELLNEFVVIDEMPELTSRDNTEQDEEFTPGIKVLAARFDINLLKVGYEHSEDIQLTGCFVDNEPQEYEVNKQGELSIRVAKVPHSVFLKGVVESEEITSNKIWVDQESLLRSTSKGRALLEKIRNSDSSQSMQAEDWMLIVELFAKDLEYTTAKEFHKSKSKNESEEDDSETVITRSDVFSETYDKAPDFSSRLMDSFSSESVNIYNLLLHAFGISMGNQASSDHQVQNDDECDDDTVDTPENLNTRLEVKPKKAEINDRVKRRISKVVNAIVVSFTDPTYLELRDPEGLGRDLQIAGLVLRKGLSEGWVDSDQFFDSTQKIWAKLFFSTKSGEPLGWLGIRYQQERDKNKFRLLLSTPQLAATLFAWTIAVDISKGDAYEKRFLSSLLLSMGRFPWLWHDDLDKDEIYLHLNKILQDSPCRTDGQTDIESLHERRVNLLRQGVALAQADFSLSQHDIGDLRGRLANKNANKGDVLWQGKRGMCISLENTVNSGESVKVLCLQDPEGETAFQKDYLMPIGNILNSGLIPDTDDFGPIQKKELSEVLLQFKSIQT